MISLTALHYKIKVSALERFHNINEYNESRMFIWSLEVDKAKDIGLEYPEKPFIEPFEFEDTDYVITERRFRVRLDDIYSYKENSDGVVELTVRDDVTYTIKETIEDLDKLFD